MPTIRSNKRKEIRKAVVKILTGQTNAKDRIYSGRSESNWQETLPHINVYLRSESTEEIAQAPRLLMRTIDLEIECIADAVTDTELVDKLDDLAEQVEILLSIDDSLLCTADDIMLKNIDVETVSDGARPTGAIRLQYNVTYHAYSPRDIRDQVSLKDLSKVGASWQVGHNDSPPTMAPADRATDEVIIT